MSGHTTQIAVALAVLIPLTLLIGSRIGEGVPFLLAILTAAVLALTIPPRHWNMFVILGAPLGAALLAGEILDRRR